MHSKSIDYKKMQINITSVWQIQHFNHRDQLSYRIANETRQVISYLNYQQSLGLHYFYSSYQLLCVVYIYRLMCRLWFTVGQPSRMKDMYVGLCKNVAFNRTSIAEACSLSLRSSSKWHVYYFNQWVWHYETDAQWNYSETISVSHSDWFWQLNAICFTSFVYIIKAYINVHKGIH